MIRNDRLFHSLYPTVVGLYEWSVVLAMVTNYSIQLDASLLEAVILDLLGRFSDPLLVSTD